MSFITSCLPLHQGLLVRRFHVQNLFWKSIFIQSAISSSSSKIFNFTSSLSFRFLFAFDFFSLLQFLKTREQRTLDALTVETEYCQQHAREITRQSFTQLPKHFIQDHMHIKRILLASMKQNVCKNTQNAPPTTLFVPMSVVCPNVTTRQSRDRF